MITEVLARMFARSRLILGLLIGFATAIAVRGYFPAPVAVPEGRAHEQSTTRSDRHDVQSNRQQIAEDFHLTRADCLLIVETDRLFEPQVFTAIRAMASDLERLDVVDSIIWLDSVPVLNMFGLPDPLLPPDDASAERFADARRRSLEHPLVAGQLLSDDGTALQMSIRLDWLFMSRPDSGAPEILAQARKSLTESLGADAEQVTLRMTGRIPLWQAERTAFASDHLKYQIIAYVLIIVLAVLLFRGIVPVLLVITAPAMAVFWTHGWLEFLDHSVNQMTAVVMPVLVAMVSFTDGVHLMIHIRRQRAAGDSPIEASAAAIRHVGLPCFLTSLTTAIGFGSLLLARSEYIQDFGRDCALGVCAGFLAVVTMIPLLSSTWIGRNLASHAEHDVVARSLMRFQPVIDGLLRHARLVTAFGVLLTLALSLLAFQLRPDEKWEYVMPTGTEAYQAMAWCDEAFGGIEYARVVIRWDEQHAPPPGFILETIRQAQLLVESEPLLKHPLSISDIVDTFPSDETDPDTLMSFATLLPGELRDLLYDPVGCEAAILMRCQDRGIREYAPVFARLDERLSDLAADTPLAITLEGRPVRRAQTLYEIVLDLVYSLGMATIIILSVLAVVYRSLRIGLIAVIPNMLPLIVTGALLYISGYALNVAAVCAFTVCLGIAVDDTIHFLSRFQHELQSTGELQKALQQTFLGVGTALVITTVVLIAGFATVMGSQMPGHRIFAGMAVSTIGTALLGDLLLLPAMLATFYRCPSQDVCPSEVSQSRSVANAQRPPATPEVSP